MAVYLKSLGQGIAAGRQSSTHPGHAKAAFCWRSARRSTTTRCATCHGDKGEGKPPDYPPLAGNQSIEMASAVNAIRMVLNGGFPPGTVGNPQPYGMPPFAQALSDDEVAAVVSYIRTAWGNRGARGDARATPTRCARPRWIEGAMINAD